MKTDHKYLYTTRGASPKLLAGFYTMKEPYVKAAWERYVKRINELYEDNYMSMCDMFSYWRCPNCDHENRYNLTWQHLYEFKEFPNDEYSKEICENCGKEYYVDSTEPNPYVFNMNRGKCKNDYVKDMVLDVSEKLTIVKEFYTT